MKRSGSSSLDQTKSNNNERIHNSVRTKRRVPTWYHSSLGLLYILSLGSTTLTEGYIAPFESTDDVRCIGLQANFSKLENINQAHLDAVQNPQGNRNFDIVSTQRIMRSDGGLALRDRVRLVEKIEGVRIRGAGAVVNFKGCQEGICAREVESLKGKTFKDIHVPRGYKANYTETDVIKELITLFDTTQEGVGTLSLEVFASTDGDHLAYFTDVLVENEDFVEYYHVIIDAHTLQALSICNLVSHSSSESRESNQSDKGKEKGKRKPSSKRYLREINQAALPRNLQCGSCAPDSEGVTWSSTMLESCPINSLYLDNTGRETICIAGTAADGEPVLGTGPVPDLHWEGTLDCKSTMDQCAIPILPTCSDSISDVHYGAIRTLEYFQKHLGVMGGLNEGGDEPVPIKAKVHYNRNYCNAFYRYSAGTVFFGDCDCTYWTPLTSIDIIAHEIAHGVTRHSSGLEYQYQSGGMNEAFSDIVGAVLEFLLDDSKDTPDFQVGEMLGKKLRSMENPGENFQSITSVCDYSTALTVHHSSGPLNLAFVNAVRSCESNGCSDLKGCTTLIGTIFMYANIQSLTAYSTYIDGAEASCSIVDEYFAAKSPNTTCSADFIVTFIRQGWSQVQIGLDENCKAVECCSDVYTCSPVDPAPQQPTPPPTPLPTSSPVSAASPTASSQPPSPGPPTYPMPTTPSTTSISPTPSPQVGTGDTLDNGDGEGGGDDDGDDDDADDSFLLQCVGILANLFTLFQKKGGKD